MLIAGRICVKRLNLKVYRILNIIKYICAMPTFQITFGKTYPFLIGLGNSEGNASIVTFIMHTKFLYCSSHDRELYRFHITEN